jgi:hypothetical protein
VSWPPKIGKPLPRAEDAYGVHGKLARYSLRTGHDEGGPKAAAFARVLGITAADPDYLAEALLADVQKLPVVEIRDRGEFGMHCRVIIPVHGAGQSGPSRERAHGLGDPRARRSAAAGDRVHHD